MNINNKLLKYIENQLVGTDKEEFEDLLESNPILKTKAEIISDLIENSKVTDPPYEVKAKIYDMFNLNDSSFMDIIIKKSSDLLEVLSGKNYLLNTNPMLITRGEKKSLLFCKKMNDYQVFCDLFLKNNGYFINLGANDNKRNQFENVKFVLKRKSNIFLEKYTDSNGHTGSFGIDPGIYDIEIEYNNIKLGNIRIKINNNIL